MVDSLARHPSDVTLSPFSGRVFDTLSKATAFPWPIMMSQCKRCRVDPAALTPASLKEVLPFLVSSVARFTSPQKGEQVRADLEALTRG